MQMYHIPVLLKESVEGLNVKRGGVYADVTFGGGGHSAEILRRLGNGRLYAFDQDSAVRAHLPEDERFRFILGNFRYIANYLRFEGVQEVDGIIADLGVSSHHIDTAERGFTYQSDAPLDMRMNRDSILTAEKIINEYEPGRLTAIFREFGEFREARKLALTIAAGRERQRIATSRQLITTIEKIIPAQRENQFLSRLFQAIRIEVNHELDNLKAFLTASYDILRKGGRMVVISYHSLEDRLVKNFFRSGNTEGIRKKDLYGNTDNPFTLVTRKPVMAGKEELARNPRAGSAKLRIAIKN